ncbi:MAG: hotdog fold thioesterase [Flavipsychrobacter sp.]|nr:hotdog fold thioesterase [Flavipsychrobacter sp.]
MTETEQILEKMMQTDAFSQWLGIVIDEYRLGYCKLHYTIRPDMVNGFNMVHGGIIFSAADSAFAFACNSQGIISVALDVHIAFICAGKPGEVFTVEAKEIYTGNKTAFYDIITTNEQGQIVSTFKGTAYRTGKLVL